MPLSRGALEWQLVHPCHSVAGVHTERMDCYTVTIIFGIC